MTRHWRRREFVRYGEWVRAVVGMLAVVAAWLLIALVGAGIGAMWD